MNLKHLIAAAAVASATVVSAPANAYDIRMTGQTHASRQLAVDVLRRISDYSQATGGCSFIFSVDMRALPRNPDSPFSVVRRGSTEIWTVNACAARQRFRVMMWPSPRGGSDYSIRPLTGRMSLAGNVSSVGRAPSLSKRDY